MNAPLPFFPRGVRPLGFAFAGLLAAPALWADVQLTSFESGLAPWFQSGPSGTVHSINTVSFTDGAASAQAVYSPTGGVFADFISVPVSNYESILQSGTTGIRADVYFEWASKPPTTGSGGAYYDMLFNLNYQGGYTTIPASSGSLTENGWATITWNLSPGQISAITASGLTYSNFGFLLNAGVYGDAVIGGTITLRFDNVEAVGASPVPEPSTYALLAGGLALAAVGARRRRA
jgi:hypothetical protein